MFHWFVLFLYFPLILSFSIILLFSFPSFSPSYSDFRMFSLSCSRGPFPHSFSFFKTMSSLFFSYFCSTLSPFNQTYEHNPRTRVYYTKSHGYTGTKRTWVRMRCTYRVEGTDRTDDSAAYTPQRFALVALRSLATPWWRQNYTSAGRQCLQKNKHDISHLVAFNRQRKPFAWRGILNAESFFMNITWFLR